MRWAQWLLLAGALSCAAPVAVVRGAGKTWTQSGAEAFSQGDLDGVSVLSSGEIVLAPPVEEIEGLEANYVWDIAVGNDGAAYVATGSPAALYVIREGKLELLHKTSEQHVLCVLPLADGSVLAGTAPRGIIFRLSAEGEVTVLEDLEEQYVWDMALGPGGEVYCATGPNGRLLRLGPAGEVSEVFKAEQNHLLCLAVDSESGNVFVGTEPDGLVCQIDAAGKASVLYDAEESEVRALVLGADGKLYAGTAQTQQGRAPQGGSSSAPPTAGTTVAPSDAAALPGQPSGANSLYCILPGEGAVRLTRFPGALVLSVVALDGGEVLAGTGVEGRLVGVSPDGVTRIVTDFQASHVSAMAVGPDRSVILGTSNGGGLWRLGRGYRANGVFTSSVFDARYLARWGRIWCKRALPERTALVVSLRTGNLSEPDETWSEWSRPDEGEAEHAVVVPPGRFAQLRAELASADPAETPRLIELGASYRQVNRRPQIQTLTIGSEQDASAVGRPRPAPSRSQDQPPGKLTVRWQATDPNEDELVFDLFYRGLDETDWKELKRNIRGESQYEWDTLRVPDGHYVLRLVASDRFDRSEPLEGERITPPFVIDNRRPQVPELGAVRQADGSYVVTGLARDSYSNIASIELSHNSGDWVPVFPDDGILDASIERFSFRTDVLGPGEHVFVVAATDSAGNTGSDKIVVRVQ